MNVKWAFPILIVFFLLAVNIQAHPYEMIFYSYSDSASPFDVNIPGFETTLSCNNQISAKASMTGTGFSLTSSFFSPGSTNIGIGTLIDQNTFTCKNIGETQTTSANGDIFESEMAILHTATSGNVTSRAFYTCSSLSTNLWLNVSINSTTDLTSYGYVVNRYSITTTSLQDNETVVAKINVSNFNDCAEIFPQASAYAKPSVDTAAAGTSDRQLQLFYPFNTSSGILRYNISSSLPYIECGSSCANELYISLHLLLVNMEDSSYQILDADSDGCIGGGEITGNFEDTLNLEKDTLFALVMILSFDDAAGCGGDARTMTMAEPEFVDYDIYIYRADLICGDWSACDGTTQTRTCIDSRGIAPPEIQFRTCALGVVENATLGFEEYDTVNDVLKCIPQWLFYYCLYNIENITVDRPHNWTIIDPSYGKANFLRMTQEYATEGTRSLKLWQIPPKPGEVIDNTTCGNLTTSIIPQLYQDVSNISFSVYYNVTFPAENMQIGFDTKKCSSQEVQHTSLTGWFNLSLCDELCYADSCDTEPRGRYVFNVQDVSTGTSIFGSPQYMDATTQTDSPLFDISDLGIEAGKIYNIVFALSHENPNDATGNCVYIDNVHYQVTEQPIDEFVGPECNSRCIGTTRYEATKTQAGSCFIVIREFSPLCMDEETARAVENNENFCSDSITLQSFNEKTGKYEAIECENACVDDRCLTEEDVEISVILASLYAPHPLIQSILIEWNLPLEDYGIVWFFNSLFMYVNYVAIGLGIGVSLVVKGGSEKAKDLYIPFIVTIMVILVASTFSGFYPLEVGIPIIVFIGLLLWKTSERIVGGHGGG